MQLVSITFSGMDKSSGLSRPSPIVIIGLGAVGRVLAGEIAHKKIAPLILVGHGKPSGRTLAKALHAAYYSDIKELRLSGGIVWLCVPTSRIAEAAAELAAVDLPWKRICVFHASGSSGADVLKRLADRGAGIAACHPYQTFPKRATGIEINGILWGLDGNSRGLRAARTLTRRLGGVPVVIPGPQRAAYHASAVMACTFIGANLRMAISTLGELGVKPALARQAVLAIAAETLRQVGELGVDAALTGPATRGDKKLVRKHVDALKKLDGDSAKVYAAISGYIVKTRSR